ncbi:peptidase U32 family protein [Streptococcus halichoeri]|uniref:peptidase U32 family protein n=1 Tax=Streptococcus halichoeri TaxID=254785 RepID=UPI001359E3D9|nr:peptidase U32 family protein [Streptococcus halichoeri]
MKKVIITATAESVAQVKALLELGVDRIYVGEENYGLRLPYNFSCEELREIAQLVHAAGKELTVACNALMHQGMMDSIKPFLNFLKEIQADYLTVGDAGLFYVNKRDHYHFKLIYDASVFATSSRQVNFWGQHGAVETVLAREIPSEELFILADQIAYPAEILVYGASVIHHSKRPLLENYYHFTHIDEAVSRQRDLFLAEPSDHDSHYSIYQDKHGTHIFMNNDVNLLSKLQELYDHGLTHWKLDGIYCPGDDFLAICNLFVKAGQLLETHQWNQQTQAAFEAILKEHHPKNRGLDTGFYDLDPKTVK